ncbi:hypothetical protein AB1A81_01220 [Bdellovibrio bacteriovorus]|uniref:Lipoprotein n=1 Tax=Bdellovibrio bacteriovorus (strain ATCC 15356 / DSM 50701 / NCIMB 9529 / HD100) TaxID=264462 RepID=Q6MR37_BDEBA|nr:hypothetical protein [Bdellovibrio bacteriovorus]AHZ85896.1 hypothetical protein EP01_13260 [Bdellovibrio bacteriovorus]BEV66817.1 hypothetical protein Bb109J_c0237 [Bdellovibrio bacteriovorus]CAE77921.1 hypothetical protein predicted by Glimmer/Critica [Bdellovibrio bacteriovorus HD100]
MAGTTIITKSLLLAALLILAACAPANDFPAIDETGNESASIVPPTPEVESPEEEAGGNTGAGGGSAVASQKLLLNQAMTLRYEKSGILENKVELPPGTQIEVPSNYEVKHLDYRTSSGAIERSSTGFLYPVKIVSVTDAFKTQFPQSKIDEINKTSGGLFVFASIVGNLEGTEGNFAVVQAASPGEGFLKYYQPSGKPKFNYVTSVTKRFGAKLNQGVKPESMSAAQREKYQSIFAELQKAVNREVATPKSYLMIDKKVATQRSIDFEKTGAITTTGAWSIATQGTAVRHGFANVPCAEFQSELLRQAYQRAGYRVTDDFNKTKGNQLIWSSTAAVVNYSMALYKAGWIAWDSTKYRPILGAIMMNGAGYTPGHTYISGSNDGLIIVDNGAPQGRDLRKTTDKTISIMFQVGVFFLPPGINPPAW